MKKIAFVIPDLNSGGMARCLETLSRGLSKDRYVQSIICLKDNEIKYDVCGNVIKIAKEGQTWIEKGWIFILRWWRLKHIFKQEQFDVIITYGMTANCLTAIAFDKHSRHIMTEHSVKSIENHVSKDFMKILSNFIYDNMIKRLYNKAKKVVVVSRYMGYDLAKNYQVKSEKIYKIYNGSDIARIRNLGMKALPEADSAFFKHPVIISVGALSALKGQWHLLRIMHTIRAKVPDAQLVILGEGEGKYELEKLRDELKLQDCVHILGQKQNPYTYMAHADVFALSSFFEGFPNVLIEAIALGLPIVSVDCKSGPRELLQPDSELADSSKDTELGEYGILTPAFKSYEISDEVSNQDADAENAFAHGLVKMLLDSELQSYYKDRSSELANVFSAANMVKKYEEIIDGI